MITWKFNELDITFKSKEANLIRDISKMAFANGLPQDTQTIIIKNDEPNSTNSFTEYGNTTSAAVPTLPLGNKKAKPGKTTIQLRNVPGDVDGLDSLFYPLTTTTGADIDKFGSDSISDEPDRQVTH